MIRSICPCPAGWPERVSGAVYFPRGVNRVISGRRRTRGRLIVAALTALIAGCALPSASSAPESSAAPWSVPFLARTPSGQVVINRRSNVTVSGFQFQNLSGNAIIVRNSSNITITANDFDTVVGAIYVQNSTNITVTWNRYRNIGDGTTGSGHSAFIQFNETTGGYIGHNKGIGGKTEDIISMWQSGGSSSSSPLVIEYNHFEGTNWTSGSGAGINMGDGGGSHMIARFNTLLNPGQSGIAISSGIDNHITDNIVYGELRPHSNVGVPVWNQYPTACSGHEIARNKVKWYRYDGLETPAWDGGNCGVIGGMWTDNDWHAPLDPATLGVIL